MHQWLWSQHDVTAGHFRRYTRVSLEKLFQDRFKIVYFSYFFSALVLPIFVLRVLPYRLLGKGSLLRPEDEHLRDGDLTPRFLRNILDREVVRIANKRSNPLGTSGLIVAQKV